MSEKMNAPHPIPYQGSKRNLAKAILHYFPKEINTLYEPFAGSAAVSLAAALEKKSIKKFHINDLNKPLIQLWQSIVNQPTIIASQYECLWNSQADNPAAFYRKIREEFNLTGNPEYFLYLLARCVKASIRYNANGEFNQSPDNRRMGTSPATMRKHILTASHLLKRRTLFTSKNYWDIIMLADTNDLVYMDPPYQGVCGNRDTRYLSSVQLCEFIEALELLNSKGICYIVSYDGRTGSKVYGRKLPEKLGLEHLELPAGRSTQATLLGRSDVTYESLYLSPALYRKLDLNPKHIYHDIAEQPQLWSLMNDQASVA